MTALPAWIDKEAWEGFVQMRRTIKKPLTDRAEKLLLKKLYEFKEKGHDPNASLDESTFANWQDVYPPKGQAVPNMNRTPMTNIGPRMTAEEKAAADEARHAVMAKLRPRLRRVA